MAINAYSAGVQTISSTNINLDHSTLADGQLIVWDFASNAFINVGFVDQFGAIPTTTSALTNNSDFVTQAQVTSQLSTYATGGGVNLTGYATEVYVQNAITNVNSSIFSGDYNDLTNKPSIPTPFSGAYADLTGTPTLFSGDYDDLINQPTIFSGDYNDLTNQPAIPSITGLATETYVNTQIAGITDNDAQTLSLSGTNITISGGNTLDVAGLQQQLQLTGTTLTIGGANGNSVDMSSFSGVATSVIGNLQDVDPTAATDNQILQFNSTTNKWESTSVDISTLADSTNLLFDGNYNSLSNRPNIPNDLLDLNITDGTNGQVLKTNGLGSFFFADETGGGGGGGISLTDISTTVSSASGAGSLSYNNVTGVLTFRPADLSTYLQSVPAQSFASLTGKPTTLAGYGITDALELGTSSTTALAGDTSIPSALTDLGITDGTANQVLTTDGSGNFTFANQSGGGSSYADSDVDTHLNTSSATANQILSWNGTDYTWVADQTGGGGGASPFTWTTSGTDNELRTATGWSEGGANYTIRQASINADNLFEVELATFSPTVTATGQTNLYWDQSATQFSVSVDNPTDFTSKHIEEVASITASTGVHTTLADYTTTGTSATPAGGIDWTQTFTTNATAAIVSNGTGTTGGTAGATITWNDESSSAWTETKTISYSWQNANVTINMSNLSGKNFLEQYNNTSYTVSVSGLQSLGNATSTVTPTGGNVSSTSGSGTFTFTTPVHKDNNDGTRTLAVSTVLSRPIGVTGTAYNITDTASDTAISSNFTYPSFTIFTVDSSTPPTKADIVDGNDFDSAVTELSNQTKQIDTTINNSDSNPRCFWFGVRTNATQPSTFEAGPSNALLSGVSVTTGNTVDLGPDTTPSGYTEEGYTLYGITLQPGNTYVRIS